MIINLNTDVGNYNQEKSRVYSLLFLFFTNHQENPRKGVEDNLLWAAKWERNHGMEQIYSCFCQHPDLLGLR